jgi:hypothetical protein
MAYTPINWVARQGILNRFNKSAETASSVVLENDTSGVTVPGTPFSPDNMNHIEQGIYDVSVQRTIGDLKSFLYSPSVAELIEKRCLTLQGQLIQIANYQDLANRMYVGDAANPTADWWYKCDSDGTRNVNGAWMMVADFRGMFVRGAGQNSKYNMANGTPYNGNVVGIFGQDTIQGHRFSNATIIDIVFRGSSTIIEGGFGISSPVLYGADNGEVVLNNMIAGDYGNPHVGPETNPAYLAVLYAITY